MPNLIIMSGISGSGKTTYATEVLSDLDPSAIYVSRDEFRENYCGVYSPEAEQFLMAGIEGIVKAALSSGHNVIYDATNLTPAKRKIPIDWGKSVGADVSIYYIQKELKAALYFNNLRSGSARVPDEVIISQHGKFVIPTEEECEVIIRVIGRTEGAALRA